MQATPAMTVLGNGAQMAKKRVADHDLSGLSTDDDGYPWHVSTNIGRAGGQQETGLPSCSRR